MHNRMKRCKTGIKKLMEFRYLPKKNSGGCFPLSVQFIFHDYPIGSFRWLPRERFHREGRVGWVHLKISSFQPCWFSAKQGPGRWGPGCLENGRFPLPWIFLGKSKIQWYNQIGSIYRSVNIVHIYPLWIVNFDGRLVKHTNRTMDPIGMKFGRALQPTHQRFPTVAAAQARRYLGTEQVETQLPPAWNFNRRSPQKTQDETLPSRKFAYPTKRENDKNHHVCKSAGYQGIS